jgi:hypothetical protein
MVENLEDVAAGTEVPIRLVVRAVPIRLIITLAAEAVRRDATNALVGEAGGASMLVDLRGGDLRIHLPWDVDRLAVIGHWQAGVLETRA